MYYLLYRQHQQLLKVPVAKIHNISNAVLATAGDAKSLYIKNLSETFKKMCSQLFPLHKMQIMPA